jgi:hypothetical protein
LPGFFCLQVQPRFQFSVPKPAFSQIWPSAQSPALSVKNPALFWGDSGMNRNGSGFGHFLSPYGFSDEIYQVWCLPANGLGATDRQRLVLKTEPEPEKEKEHVMG